MVVDFASKFEAQVFLSSKKNISYRIVAEEVKMMLAVQNQRNNTRSTQSVVQHGAYNRAYEEMDEERYRHGGNSSGQGGAGCIPHAGGLKQFWQIFKEHFNLKDSNNTISADFSKKSDLIVDATESTSEHELGPYLTQASTFHSSKEVLTIQTQQIVLPGSELQQQMAEAMIGKLEVHEDECVICMETFDATNPRIPTLCGCGENKTYFHLPCLYQWTEQSNSCPSCRKELTWEEF